MCQEQGWCDNFDCELCYPDDGDWIEYEAFSFD